MWKMPMAGAQAKVCCLTAVRTVFVLGWRWNEEKGGRWERMVIGRKNRSSSLMRTSYFKIKKRKEGRKKKKPIWVYLMHPTCAQIAKPPIASSGERVTAVPWFDEGGIFIIIHWQDVHKTPIYKSAAAEYYNNQASAACTEGCTRGLHSSFSSSSFSSSFSSYIKGNCVLKKNAKLWS